MELEEITGAIIGAAIAVHRALGPGFVESVYEAALGVELSHRDIGFERQLQVPISYRGEPVGVHRIDLPVAGSIVVELKAVQEIQDIHFVIVRSYLRATDRRHALVINFGKSKLEVRRVATRENRDN